MHIRKLKVVDGGALWALRLRALIDNPEAFAATYEETLRIGKDKLHLMVVTTIDAPRSCALSRFLSSEDALSFKSRVGQLMVKRCRLSPSR